MRIKTMIIIIITVLFTVVVMQNTDAVFFTFLFATFHISKLVMMLVVALFAFIIGFLAGRPGRPKYIPGHNEENETAIKPTSTLSDEDRDYIN